MERMDLAITCRDHSGKSLKPQDSKIIFCGNSVVIRVSVAQKMFLL